MLPPFEEALADARGRCHPEQPWSVFRHGIDTVSFAWRDFDADAALRRLAGPRPDPATGERLAACVPVTSATTASHRSSS